MKLWRKACNPQRVVNAHLSSRVSVSGYVDDSSTFRLFQQRCQQVRKQKVTQIIHLQMCFIAVGCLCERVECDASIIDENIHFTVVALLNYENLLHHFAKRVKIFHKIMARTFYVCRSRIKFFLELKRA